VNLLTIHVPPLRERIDDLDEIVRHLLGTGTAPKMKITEDAVRMLKMYSWPGNIRELRNVLERAAILSRGETLRPEHFSWLKTGLADEIPCGSKTLEDVERSMMLSTLERCGGDVKKAAKELGISRATLYRRLKEIREKDIE
jgi:transcriptional regulator of acetoin/glycerol metabolism